MIPFMPSSLMILGTQVFPMEVVKQISRDMLLRVEYIYAQVMFSFSSIVTPLVSIINLGTCSGEFDTKMALCDGRACTQILPQINNPLCWL